jgi:hypothetical protein
MRRPREADVILIAASDMPPGCDTEQLRDADRRALFADAEER